MRLRAALPLVLLALLLLGPAPSDAAKRRKPRAKPRAAGADDGSAAAAADMRAEQQAQQHGPPPPVTAGMPSLAGMSVAQALEVQTAAMTSVFGGIGWRTRTVLGIDLGTTTSSVGVSVDNTVEIITNEDGHRSTPSVIAFDATGERLVGAAATHASALSPIHSAKRLIGRKFKDSSVKTDSKKLPFKIVDKDGTKPYIEVDGAAGAKKSTLSPEEVSADILARMKTLAETHLGHEVRDAVLTVPAFFNDGMRQATKDAGRLAGLNVRRVINEPTAAALAYGLDKKGEGERTILVFHLGGGTFDLTLLTLDDGLFEVIATGGDTHLGGGDFTERTLTYFTRVFQKKTGADVTKDAGAMATLRAAVEQAKHTLSTAHQAKVMIKGLFDGKDLSETIKREVFEKLNEKLFAKTLKAIKKLLKEAGISKGEVNEYVLVGGSSRIPKVQTLLREFFDGKEPHKGISPDEVVAYGAAVQGGVLAGESKDEEILAEEWKDPAVIESVTRLATLLFNADRTEEALVFHETCVRANPDNGAVHVKYGTALGVDRVPEAERVFRTAVQLLGEEEEASDALAKWALSLAKLPNRMPEALEAYTRSIAAPPPKGQTVKSRAMLLTQRAMALSAMGQAEEAREQAKEALVLDPNQQLAHKIARESFKIE